MTRMIQHSLVLIVLLHGHVCLGGTCYCFNADELALEDKEDEYNEKGLSSCSACSEDQIFIYKFNVKKSCVGRCGDNLNKSLPCQCNKPCTRHKDCCEDYDAFCSEKGTFVHVPQVCPVNGNFITMNQLSSCINFDQKMKNRTAKTSSHETFVSIDSDENGEWNVLKCTEGETSEERLLVKSSSFECSDLVSLYCRNGSSAQKSITTMKSQKSNFTTPMKPDQITPPIGSSPQRTLTTVKTLESNFTTPMKPDQITPPIGVIVGIVSSIIVIGVVIFVVIVCRRRRSAKRKLVLKEDAHGQNDTEKTEHLENKNNYAYSEIEMEATNKKDHMDNGDNEYTTGPSDVYDHLNEKRNRKVQTENPHAIYDHAIGDNAEPDYDSTKHVVPTNPDYQEVTIRSEDESYREKL